MISRRRAVAAGIVLGALAVCGWFEAALAPFGAASSVVTFSVAAVLIALGAAGNISTGLVTPPDGESLVAVGDTSLRRSGTVAWLLAGGLVLAVELWELFHSPRRLYPTLSSLANEVVGPGHRVGRAVAFVLWGACGLLITGRARRRS